MSRLQLLVAVLLAAIAAATGWMLFRDFDQSKPDRFAGPSRPSYELIDFELDAFDEHGKIAFRTKAPRLLHDERVKGMAVTTPQFRLYGDDGQSWQARSATAWIDHVAKRIDLESDVAIRRDTEVAGDAWSMTTERLVAHTETRRIETDRVVDVRRPGSILSGRGLSADLNEKTFELKADVHGSFDPKR
ncbi:MAG TPA: LPS export ABC transporter periplasmic protein LptC [Patescibacteria group bacterium]|nr:LPS export ABC transporter periplasmic protein LptC [Patescibacteria group bacterium]